MKKWLAMTLALLMLLGVLSSCGNAPAATDPAETPTDTKTDATDAAPAETPSDTADETPDASADEPSVEIGANAAEITSMDRNYFPLSEQETLSMWTPYSNSFVHDLNDHHAIQWMESETNVHVNFTMANEPATQLMLMLSSGDVSDIIDRFSGANGYFTQTDTYAAEEGIILDMTSYIPQYMPNYWALMQSDPDVMRDVKTDEGTMPVVYTLNSYFGQLTAEPIWLGLVYREDWAQELGYDQLVTIDDWHSFLTACKERYETCDAPLGIPSVVFDISGDFVTAYGTHKDFYVRDGKIAFGPLDEGYRDAVQNLVNWYSEGLIDIDFPSYTNMLTMADYDKMGRDESAAMVTIWGLSGTLMSSRGMSADPDLNLLAARCPVLNEGDTSMTSYNQRTVLRETQAISADTAKAELAMRWLDQWFSYEASLHNSMGEENVTYYRDDQGYGMHFYDNVGSSDLYEINLAQYNFSNDAWGLMEFCNMDITNEDNNGRDSVHIWDTEDASEVIPLAVSMTAEESEEYGTLWNNASTYLDENLAKFVTGQRDMSEWDDFVAELNGSFNIARCIELKQAAYDRYLNR